ncbi:MAG: carbonic anhydrase [Chlamydiae bacterium]|nr:carbonic anhydrase [Chlamydiota bacterium]
MRVFLSVFCASILFCSPCFTLTPDEALTRLLQGNERYMQDKLTHPDRSYDRRESLLTSQQPFAIILGCSDSRVAPEILFDQGIGDLFVVRVAGNVVDPIILDSMEYAAKYLGSCLIIVLGHENCGAVKAVMAGQTEDIEAIAGQIRPAIKECKKDHGILQTCVKANVHHVVDAVKQYATIKKLLQQNKVKVVGGYYSLASGKVEIIP